MFFPKSLQAKLLLGLSLSLFLVIVAGSVGTYFFFRYDLYRELDHALYDKLRFLRASCMQEESEVVFKLTESVWAGVWDEHDPEYFQVWMPNGETLHRSWKATAGDLPNLGAKSRVPVFADVTLPSGIEGRGAGMSFFPHQEGDGSEPILVSVAVAHDTGRIARELGKVWRYILIWGVISGGFVLLATLVIVRRNLRPLMELTGQIDRIPVGAEQKRFELTNAPTELDPVVERLNALMGRVDVVVENERQFTANAAHELRNPLAGMRSQLELALSKPRSPVEYQETLSGVLEVEMRLQSMVENLLLLTRLQTGQDKIAIEGVSIPAMLRRSWKPFFAQAEAKNLEVAIDCIGETALVNSSGDLLEIVCRNLFDNAVSYTPRGGKILIRAGVEEDRIRLRVANTNPGLAEGDLEKLFGRFWRASTAREGDHLHAGIGLALIQRIAEVLGGEVEARLDREGMFEIVFWIPGH